MEEAARCQVDWQLAPFLKGFCEEPFTREVQNFLRRHAADFCRGGKEGESGYPLRWTELHSDYIQLFERQLKSVVQEEGFSLHDFHQHLSDLSEAARTRTSEDFLPGCGPSYIPPAPGIKVAEFWSFLDALTASTDFAHFLEVMQREAGKVQEVKIPCV
ncbi:unnamed protein product, partial [Cladocopium goreaui]